MYMCARECSDWGCTRCLSSLSLSLTVYLCLSPLSPTEGRPQPSHPHGSPLLRYPLPREGPTRPHPGPRPAGYVPSGWRLRRKSRSRSRREGNLGSPPATSMTSGLLYPRLLLEGCNIWICPEQMPCSAHSRVPLMGSGGMWKHLGHQDVKGPGGQRRDPMHREVGPLGCCGGVIDLDGPAGAFLGRSLRAP